MIKMTFLFLLLLAYIKASSFSWQRLHYLRDIYDDALEAIKEGNHKGLVRILTVHGHEIREAVEHQIHYDSLLFQAAFRTQDPKLYRLLIEEGIEVDGSEVFARLLRIEDFQIRSVDVAKDLVAFGFVQLEDLWKSAIEGDSLELFQWLRLQGANQEHRIPKGKQGEFETVLGMCYLSRNTRFIEDLLSSGASVNAPPKTEFLNLWHLALTIPGSPFHIQRIAALTENLFTPFYDAARKYEYDPDMESLIYYELKERLEDGTVDFAALDTADDELGWTLLDRVCLFHPGVFERIINILLHAGLPQNFPLTSAFHNGRLEEFEAMVKSGEYDLNERASPTNNLLSLLIQYDRPDAKFIELLIDHGAEVRFTGMRYREALHCAFIVREHPLPIHLIKKIAEKLSVEELRADSKLIVRSGFRHRIKDLNEYISEV